MLLVHATKGPSKIHGFGLIAREFIPEGTHIWRFQAGFDLELQEADLALLSEPARLQVFFYGYYDIAQKRYILCSDDDRFTNHSDDPNTTDFPGGGLAGSFALRDIHSGEEITWDYRPWSETGGLKHFSMSFSKTQK